MRQVSTTLSIAPPPTITDYPYFTIRYYETDYALTTHWRTKIHKRRCKTLKEPAYTIEESQRAAGLGKEGKRPTHTQPEAASGGGMITDVPVVEVL